ncbi:hypothetical protein HMPREF9946_03276 [Acetobacteraceae bacterium AT-5844]|nr:hypothetical protein HMPREF9946_03276 [Acetobacteraceae bacterium AT-5844]
MSNSPTGQAEGAPGLTRSDRLAHLIIVALLCLISVSTIYTSMGFPGPMSQADVGPGRFPIIYAVGLLGLTLILLFQTLAKPVVNSTDAGEAPRYGRIAAGMLAMLVMLLAIGTLGYFICALALMVVLMFLLGQRSPIWNPVIAVCITSVVYFLFDYGLNVPLPSGTLFE